jgi:iron complex outermembrane recepter protein
VSALCWVRYCVAGIVALAAAANAQAQVGTIVAADSARTDGPESVLVIGTAPADTRTVDAADVAASHALTTTDLLNDYVPSVFLSDTESNPFQEDLYYRGFDASPVLGTPQGLAIYQGGTRINQHFGDTILWDLVPSFAIRSIDVVPGSDPVFGLNALGGAIVLNMKTGFDAQQGEQIDVAGGSFGRARLIGETAHQFGNEAFYLGASAVDDSGWRWYSESQVYQTYADFAVRAPRASAGVSLTLVTDDLNENAAVPVQDFTKAAFAIPDTADDRDFLLQGRGEYDFSSDFIVRGSLYARVTHIATQNGGASGFAACTAEPALLCDDNGNPLETNTGASIPASLGGVGEDPIETIATTALGGSVEMNRTGTLFGYGNSFVLGDAFDRAYTGFASNTLLSNLTFQPGGVTAVPIGIYLGGAENQVWLRAANLDEGLYAQDTLALSSAISLEISGRYHFDQIGLTDRLGTALTGTHDYEGVNPAVELVWQAAGGIKAYAEFEQSGRTPTAAELSCANPLQPCLFPLSFLSDPGLRQVIARTAEMGAKGVAVFDDVSLDWSADIYGTRNQNDIIFESSGPTIASGYFANVGTTQRLGAEIALHAAWQDFELRANYGFVNATFESAFTDPSANNPAADANGNIYVVPGDRMPSIPRSTAKLNLSYAATPRLHLGLNAKLESAQFLRGDEANLEKPLPAYYVFGAEAEYQLSDHLQLYFEGENLLDQRYATFGLYGDPTGNGAFPQFSNPRFIVPAQPFGVWGGVKVSW